MNRFSFAAVFVSLASAFALRGSDVIPGPEQQQPIALIGATIHPISQPEIEVGSVLFDKGRIVAVGADIEIPDGAQVIDVKGKHIYPGLFNAAGILGLVEINSIDATIDVSETGQINPNVRAEVAVNPDSELIPVTRSNGVLLSLTMPAGGLISGTAAILQLDGWTWEDLTLKSRAGLCVNWPNVTRTLQAEKSDENPLRPLEQVFDDAIAYRSARDVANSQQPVDLKLEAMIPVLDRSVPLIVRANSISQIHTAVEFANRRHVRLIIYGGYDAEACATLLRENDVPVIIDVVYRLPARRSDPFDAAYTLPERLRKANVKFCIAGRDRFGASNLRNLPYHAATAAAYGLPIDEAIRAITLSPAEILGVDDQVGSLDVGKMATLIVCSGNPLETSTQVSMAYVGGRKLDLNNRHKQLWRKYRQKYRVHNLIRK